MVEGAVVVSEGWREGGRLASDGKEGKIHLPHRVPHCRDYANVPCARGLRDWASELNYLITALTKSPGLSPAEI